MNNTGLEGLHDYAKGFRNNYLGDVAKGTKLGVSFSSGDLGIAFQFDLGSLSFYLSGNYKITDSISAGINFEGYFPPDDYRFANKYSYTGNRKMAFGLEVNFGSGAFGLEFKAAYAQELVSGAKGSVGVVLTPSFKVDDTHLAASLDIGVYHRFESGYKPIFSVIPQVWYNVMGTGSGAKAYYYPVNTGIGVRYRFEMSGSTQVQNSLDFCFKWGF
jgi:hypothetical protein